MSEFDENFYRTLREVNDCAIMLAQFTEVYGDPQDILETVHAVEDFIIEEEIAEMTGEKLAREIEELIGGTNE